MKLGDLVRAYLADQCAVLIDAEPALRERAEVVHDTRVAARRLRSTLRTYGEVVDIARAGTLSDELVWYAGLLGAVRDLEVLEERMLADLAALPAELVVGPIAHQIQTELSTQRSVAWDAVIAAQDTPRYQALLAELCRWRDDAPLTSERKAPATKAKKYVKRANRALDRRLDRAIEALQTGNPDADLMFHAARKAGKRARYAVELAAPVLGKKADKIIAARKDLQDLLGEHQDSIVAAEFLRAEGVCIGIRSGHNGFTYGLLYGRELAWRAAIGDRLQPYLNHS